MYEEWGLIPRTVRRENGYRSFTDVHIDQFKLARTAFQTGVLQNELRQKIAAAVKISALGHYDEALVLSNEYIASIETEIKNAGEAVVIAYKLFQGLTKEEIKMRKLFACCIP